jgi:hypothetical protein
MLEPKPAHVSEPPPPPVPLKPSRPPGRGPLIARPMSIVAACGWSLGTTLLFFWLASITVALRPAARYDLVNSFGCQVVAYLAGLFLILRVHAPDGSIREILGVRGTHPAFYPLGAALGFALVLPVNSLYDFLEHRFPSPTSHEDRLVEILLSSTPGKRVVIGLIVVLLGPLLEEVFFRGALLSPLRRRHAIPASVVATAALFAIAHDQWQMYLPIGVVGVALGLLRVASGSLVPSVLLHATFNAVPFYAVLATGSDEPSAAGARWPALVGSTALAAVLAFVIRWVATTSEDAARAQEKDRR